MPCENCSVQFTVFKRKRACCECDRFYCTNCIGRGVGLCDPCKILSSRPLGRRALDRLRVRDLQCFLHRQNISTRGCVEKDDLVELVLAHVNSGNFKRKTPTNSHGDFSSTFASLKGFTNNINNLLSSAFDIGSNNASNRRPQNPPHAASQNTSQFNGTNNSTRPTGNSVPHSRSASSHSIPSSAIPTPRSTTVSPRVRSPVEPEQDIQIIPEHILIEEDRGVTITRNEQVENNESENPNRNNTTQTTDCIEIEDIDEGWEMLGQVPEPLPLDSEELIADVDLSPPLRSSARASSEFNLSSSRIPTVEPSGESSSLNESMFHAPPKKSGRINLQDLKDLSDVENLSVKQLKELLILNRVDFKGCCERNELLERATRLWIDSTKSREDIEKAPLEELCKICMDAPMECVMLECGHIATCTACGKRLNECPICRQYVTRVVRFFKS